MVLVGMIVLMVMAADSFSSTPTHHDSDLRMVYCAFAISSMLNDWRGVDVPRALGFVARCRVRVFFSLP